VSGERDSTTPIAIAISASPAASAILTLGTERPAVLGARSAIGRA
jgi:hypothetical protein